MPTDDDIDLETKIIGNWKLIQMTGNLLDSDTLGADMEWQETYLLQADETFIKLRDRDGVITEASGTYHFINNSNKPLITVTFDNESEIVGSCTSKSEDIMSLESETIFFKFLEYM
ncbi:hypothetical protein [uncultured Formosa sp.]|uniref:hypothetical protein n=1 Tax=uncultured Formosa sp. TaxID=255435 RepID=UPI0026237880|nr:hypothetical protein [uncultured Formosa sp.]